MKKHARPTIKGVFVKSHVLAVRKAKGSAGVRLLEKRLGHSVDYRNFDSVPVRDEVHLIEAALDILHPLERTPEKRAFEAGRLHFRNFRTTPLAKIIFSVYRRDFRTIVMNASNIAGHVFRGVIFTTVVESPRTMTVQLENNDYPLEHFQGFFTEWMHYSGLKGHVDARVLPDGRYAYTMVW